MGHATLGPIGGHRAMQASFGQPLAHTDDFAAMSFVDLESLADDLSESSQWSLLDDIRGELINRMSDTRATLARLFVDAMNNAHAPSTPKLPTVTCRRIDLLPVPMVALQHIEESAATEAILRTYCAGPDAMRAAWAEHVAAMATAYAEANAEDLLRAGWTE